MPPYVIVIDNYDSFTWNVYEVLCREGADVDVFRNDKITVAEIVAKAPDLILISPGPGNPEDDAGISREVIRSFIGKVPIFGVCMGLQCIVAELGGVVEYAGEIVHGKTSLITHTNKGVFEGVPQSFSATRYHSLAARIGSLPQSLEVTAVTDSGVIQGVRHKELTVEGVQFHPESILTQEGARMLRNFLSYRGGKWPDIATAPPARNGSVPSSESILDKIYTRRRQDVEHQKAQPGLTLSDIDASLAMGLAPPVVNFRDRLAAATVGKRICLLAEVKRASPSKGDIAVNINAPRQARQYAEAGAAAISVLTEPHWFKGCLEDLRLARLAVDKLEDRPAILRKEFIFSRYQIAEARLAGADSVLLIVKMLEPSLLQDLYKYSRQLGMEPLVEVANLEEMHAASALGAEVIGVNNRDLHSFFVDLGTTTKLSEAAPDGALLIALSGISNRDQVQRYTNERVKGILVGEALMRAPDPAAFVRELID